jgi:lipoprotein-releasing system permease protein
MIVVGLSAGMMALIVMLSLMNSLQRDLLNQLKDIESFHVQVSFPAEDSDDLTVEKVVSSLNSVDYVQDVFAQVNTQVLVQNPVSGRASTARLRLIDSTIFEQENPFSQRTIWMHQNSLESGELAVGGNLAARLGVSPGQILHVTVLVSGKAAVLAPLSMDLVNVGIFRTGLSEFDQTTMIADLDPFLDRMSFHRITYALYLEDAHADYIETVINTIQQQYPQATVRSWQQINQAFYSALTLEKMLMYLFLFFMFIILGVNMKNASSRLLHVKQRELAVLRSLGAGKQVAARVFLGQSLIITGIGEFGGIVLGLLASNHIGTLFSWINAIQYLFTRRTSLLLAYPFTTYVKEGEIVIIALCVLAISLLFTYAGCRRQLYREPMEMLYHD